MSRRIAVLGMLLFALLGMPRTSNAGILELIWEMSGPQMVGLGYGCLYSLKPVKQDHCRIGSTFFSPAMQKKNVNRGPYLALGASIFGSTGRDSATQGYDWGEIWMLALEPGLAVRSYECGPNSEVQVHHGVGISYDLMFGRDIRRFDKFAITVTPIDVVLKRVAVGIKLRMYPNGFTDDEFKPGPTISQNRPFEATLGFTFSVILDRP